MKTTINTLEFVNAVNWAIKSFDAKDDKAFVSLSLNSDGTGFLSHMNNTSFMKAPFTILDSEFEGEEKAELALDARFLQKLASVLGGNNTGNVVLSKEMDDNKSPLRLKTSAGRFTIPTVKANAYTEGELTTLGTVDDTEYFDSVQRLSKLCDVQNSGFFPALEVVDIQADVENNVISMMATDRYALGEIKINFTPESEAETYFEENPHLFLPHSVATLISPSKELQSSLTLVTEVKGGKFGYMFNDGRIALFALKTAEPILYDSLKIKASEIVDSTISLNVNDFKKAIDTICALAWEENDIYLEIKEDSLVVHDSNGTNRATVENVTVDTDEEYSIKFVRSVLKDAFHPISTEKMNVKFKDKSSAFVLESILDNGEVDENVFVLTLPAQN